MSLPPLTSHTDAMLSGQFKWLFYVRRILARRINSSCFSHAHDLAQSQFTFVSPTSGMATPVYFAQLFSAPGSGTALSLADIGVCARSKPGIMPTNANMSKLTFRLHCFALLPGSDQP